MQVVDRSRPMHLARARKCTDGCISLPLCTILDLHEASGLIKHCFELLPKSRVAMDRMLEDFKEDFIGLSPLHEQILGLLGEDASGRDCAQMRFCSASALNQAD